MLQLIAQWILSDLGVPCFKVCGKDHAWNKVKLDGVWYNVDVTWMDGGGAKYFLKSDRTFTENSHIFNDEMTTRCFASGKDYT